MKNKLFLLTLGMLLLSVTSILAGNSNKIGTAGATELLIPVGARGVSLGGAVIADPGGVEATYWNPAGLALIEGTEVAFSHQPYIADIKVNWFGAVTNIEGFGALGVSAKVVSIGDIEETTEQFPEGTGNVYSPTLSVIGLSYAKMLTASVSIGGTASLVHESVFKVSATGVAFDFGVIYDPRWRGLKFGMAIKNYGPSMSYAGAGFDLSSEDLGTRNVRSQGASFELPSHIDLGASYAVLNQDKNAITLDGVFRSNNFQEDMFHGGAEYSYDGKYFLRGGYNYSSQSTYLYGASLGAGFVLPFGDNKLSFDYTWSQTDVFDDNQFFSFKANF